jgi:LacI family transcriptional regulator
MDEVQKSRVTLLDIAADADVSRSTVSLVIRNVPSVAETTRKRVLRSVKRLGYVYHRGAASLRRQHSHAIGLIVSDITNPFFAEVIVAIEDRLAKSGFVTLLGNTSEDRFKEERLLRTAIVRRSADYAMAIDAAAVRDKRPTLKGPGRFLGGVRDSLYHPQSQPDNCQNYFHGFFSSI